VIVGSDQVWNGNILGTSVVPFFLGFVDQRKCRRISYAACFGDYNQPPQTIEAAGSLLHHFDCLSVRDRISHQLVNNLSGRDAEIVLDPCLLHDYGDKLSGRIFMGNYIATYFLSHTNVNTEKDALQKIREYLQMPVIAIGEDRKTLGADHHVLSAGPSEWVQLLQGAAFVYTDSFHGTVFAVKYGKPFVAWSNARHERIQDFLAICGIQNRLVSATDLPAFERLLRTPIDYQAVSERFLPHINRSITFLEEALSTVPSSY
jgi:hypothetical protein